MAHEIGEAMICSRTSPYPFVLTGLVFVVASALASGAARSGATAQQPVDAATFAAAVLQGRGDEYKGRTISGIGADFHGSSPSLELTVGSAADEPPKAISTWDEFIAAQRARTTLVVSLKVAGFQRTSWPKRGTPPALYEFTGVFNGTMKTIPRMGVPSDPHDSGPCPGSQPTAGLSSGPMSRHCVPVLDEAKIQIR